MNQEFTKDSMQAIEYARDEAIDQAHGFMGTEHILLGLIRLGRGRAILVLTKLGVDLDELNKKIEDVMRATKGLRSPLLQLGPTRRAKRVLDPSAQEAEARESKGIGTKDLLLTLLKEKEAAAQQAEARESKEIGTEDLLLALVKDKESTAAKVLSSFGIDYQKVQDELKKV